MPSWELRPFPGYESSNRELGLAYAEVGDRTGNRRQHDAVQKLLAVDLDDPAVLMRLAHLAQQAGDKARAAELYRKGLQLQPYDITALVNLGGLEAGDGNYGAALSLWRRALSANPAQPEAARNVITLLRALGRTEEAARVEAQLRSFGE